MNDKLSARFAALANPHDDSDWLDVLHRAGVERRRRSRAWIALPLAATLVALAVGSAFAYYRDVVDFFGAEEAPRPIVDDFESLSVGAPPGMDPQAIAGETRRVEVATLSGEHTAVFISPTKAGGYCSIWTASRGGGCDKLGRAPLNVSWWARGGHGDKPGAAGIDVSVAPYVSTLELRFSDGEVLRPPITWVSEPIDRGFAFFEYSPRDAETFTRQLPLGRRPRSGPLEGRRLTVVALDGDGRVVTAEAQCCDEEAVPPPEADLSQKEVAVSIATRSGPATIWTAPTRYDATCSWLEFGGQTSLVRRCMPAGYGEDGMALRLLPTEETVLLTGTVPERYGSLVLRYADGDRQSVPLDGPFFLVEIPERHLEPETRLRTMTVYRDDGRVITTWSSHAFPAEGTKWAPCSRVLPLPPGRTCP